MKFKFKYYHDITVFFAQKLENDEDVSLIITGPKGLGKSTLMIYLMLANDAYFHDNVADVDKILRRITWEDKSWFDMLQSLNMYESIGMDEAGNVWDVQKHLDLINRLLTEAQRTNRYLRLLKIFTTPGFVDIQTHGRRTINYWIRLERKGFGSLYYVYPFDGPDQTTLKFIKEKVMLVNFSKLPRGIYQRYLQIKNEVEQKRYALSKSIIAERDWRQLPLNEKLKRVAQALLALRREGKTLEKTTVRSGKMIRTLDAKVIVYLLREKGIYVSDQFIRRYFDGGFRERGWQSIEEMA